MIKYIILFIFSIYCSDAYSQKSTWRMVDKISLITSIAAPRSAIDYDFPLAKDSKASFQLHFYYDSNYCKKSASSRLKQIRAALYLVQEYSFKDSLRYCDSVRIRTFGVAPDDSTRLCEASYKFQETEYREFSAEDKLTKIAEAMPYDAVFQPDVNTPGRLLLTISFKNFSSFAPYIEFYFINVVMLVYDFIIRPANFKKYDKLTIICKQDNKVVQLSSYNFKDERYARSLTRPLTEAGPYLKPFPKISYEKFKGYTHDKQ